MALQGTFDTFPLPDVLSLLASTSKVGRLDVAGHEVTGTLWVDGPSIVGAVSGPLTGAVEVLVQLLRLEEGEFLFQPGELPSAPGHPYAIDDALAAASAHLAEWVSVESVLPSPDHVITLRRALPAAEVTITAPEWAGIVAIGEGGPARTLLGRFGEVDLEAARALVALIGTGLLEVVPPADGGASWLSAAPPAPAPAREVRTAPKAAAAAPDEPVPVPVAPPDGGDLTTGQPWRDQVRQLLGTAHPDEPPRIVAERFGPSHAAPAAPPGQAPSLAQPAAAPADGEDRDALLRFLGSVQP